MTDLRINEVSIEPVDPKDGLIGFASFVVNGDIKINSIGVHTCPTSSIGIRLVFPQKEYRENKINTVYPINCATYEVMAVAVSSAYRDLMNKLR